MNKVVARFTDGRMLKGTAMNLDPSKPSFHIRPVGGKAEQVELADLKALFFVRSLDGNPGYEESDAPDPGDPRARGSTTVKLDFGDGETLVGLTIRYPPIKKFFYVVPVDPKSNNIRVLVNGDAVVAMEALT